MPWGLIPVSAYAQRALTVICPPDPQIRGTPYCQIIESSRRAEDKICDSSCHGPQGPIWSEIKKCLRYTDTAYSGKAVAAGPPTTAALHR